MTHLNCCVGACAYNKNECCCLNSIKVGGDQAESSANTCCDSFAEKSSSFTNDAMVPETHLDVTCKAEKCIYNTNGLCSSDHINISGISASANGDTLCATFQCE